MIQRYKEKKKVCIHCACVHATRVWICMCLCCGEKQRLGEIKRCEWVGLCQQKRILFEIHRLHFSSTKSKTYVVCSLNQSGGRSEQCRREEKWQEIIEIRKNGWCMWRFWKFWEMMCKHQRKGEESRSTVWNRDLEWKTRQGIREGADRKGWGSCKHSVKFLLSEIYSRCFSINYSVHTQAINAVGN